jgi:hypothetical protein
MEDEVWKVCLRDAPYEVSNLGRVRRAGRVRKLVTAPNGYPMVTMSHRGRRWGNTVHRMVCEAFHGPADGRVVRHKDNDRGNPREDNLEWGSRADNEADKHRHGTMRTGERHHMSRLSDEQVAALRDRAARRDLRYGQTRLFVEREAKSLGVSVGCVRDIIYGNRRNDH